MTNPVELTASISKPIVLAPAEPGSSRTWTAPRWVDGANCIVFSDGAAVYGYSSSCNWQWTITARQELNGWTVGGSYLYAQDGSILAQYSIEALIRHGQPQSGRSSAPLPDNAFDFGKHAWWTSQLAEKQTFAEFAAASDAMLKFSAPALVERPDDDPLIYVLASDGTVFCLPPNQDAQSQLTAHVDYQPDSLELFVGRDSSGALLFFLSGGQVVTLTAGGRAGVRSQQPLRMDPGMWLAQLRDPGGQAIPFMNGMLAATAAGMAAWDDGGGQLRIAAFCEGAGGGSVSGIVASQVWARPLCRTEGDATFVYVLTGPWEAPALAKYKLVPVADPKAPVATALFDAEFAYAEGWRLGGGVSDPAPFEQSTALILLAQRASSLGLPPLDSGPDYADATHMAATHLLGALRERGVPAPRAVDLLSKVSGPPWWGLLSGMLGGGYPPVDAFAAFRGRFPDVAIGDVYRAAQEAGLAAGVIAQRLIGYGFSTKAFSQLGLDAQVAVFSQYPIIGLLRFENNDQQRQYQYPVFELYDRLSPQAGGRIADLANDYLGFDFLQLWIDAKLPLGMWPSGAQVQAEDAVTCGRRLEIKGLVSQLCRTFLPPSGQPMAAPGGVFWPDAVALGPVLERSEFTPQSTAETMYESNFDVRQAVSVLKEGFTASTARQVRDALAAGGYDRGSATECVQTLYGVSPDGSVS